MFLNEDNGNITLKTGRSAELERIKNYFNLIFESEKSGEKFPVHLAYVWELGYTEKRTAVAALKKKYKEGYDYQVSQSILQNPLGGRPEEIYHLTTQCFEYLIARERDEIFEVYRQCRIAITSQVNRMPTHPEALRGWATALEANQLLQSENKELAREVNQLTVVVDQQNEAIRKKEAEVDLLIGVKNTYTITDIAKELQISAKALNQRLLNEKVIYFTNKDRYEYSYYAHYSNYFIRKQFKTPSGFSSFTLHVTPEGRLWLLKRFKKEVE
ncbi:phage antirepressor KilAC domain-containing protein [Xanthocytophaga agilis]|uniref:Phage antirepressor KilAC domain-containing protein n=1 Tax=Xanthocytophaga agilis TaxID=3048010 RepID=A0AAE3R2Z2_9BACT|nr:phage antirepressor KilAC domain-containing protein [Xanthocytophaga agilis]MDJ1500652.1 phage antirepressor KilAC domain-containing protein [Xanthocytophaga agilis]